MKFRKILTIPIIVILIFGIFSACDKVTTPYSVHRDGYVGYIASALTTDGYYVLNSNSEILKFSSVGSFEKKVLSSPQKLYDIAVCGQNAVTVGKDSAIYLSRGEDFVLIDNPPKYDFTCVCENSQGFTLGTSSGAIVKMTVSDGKIQFEKISDGFGDAPCEAIAYGVNMTVAITADGRIITVGDDKKVSFCAVNDFYSGEYIMRDVEFSVNSFWIIGNQTDLSSYATAFISQTGNIWSKRTIDYIENVYTEFNPPLIPYSLMWDGEQMLASCSEGRILTMPDCARCNKLTDAAEKTSNIYTVSTDKKGMLLADSNSSVTVIPTESVRQNTVSVDTAKRYMRDGAVLIDVRGADEYNQHSVEGSVNVPLEQLENLQQLYPKKETTLIFICKSGIRSSTAVDQAKKMGYVNVYNAGKIDDWKIVEK